MPLQFRVNMRRPPFAPFALLALGLLALGAPVPAQAPVDRKADNLTAYARLLAMIRFFHPSDEAAAADWNRVAVAGVAAVENAPDAPTLARSLDDFFRPLAPTVRVFPTGARPALPEALRPEPSTENSILVWRHFGGKFEGTSKAFRSERISNQAPRFGTLLQAIAPGDLKGRRVRLRAKVRSEIPGDARFQLGLRIDRPNGQPGFLDNMADRPVVGTTDWRTIEIEGEVAPDAERIVVLAVLLGPGRVWLDEVSLAPLEGRTKQKLANGGFDEGEVGAEPPGWDFPYESIGAGYHLDLDRGAACSLDGCAVLSSDEVATPRFGRPDQPLTIDLGAGVSALVPIALWADAEGTLPHATRQPAPPTWATIDPAPDNRETRIAALLLGWGNLAHFHPTLDLSAEEWTAALRASLPEALAAATTDREAFRRAVHRLLIPLRDPVANDVDQREDPPRAWLPIEWEWIEGRLVVTQVYREIPGLRKGDLVLDLDGQPAAEALDTAEALISGTTEEARRALALNSLRIGAPGTSVTLRVQDSSALHEVLLTRPGKGITAPALSLHLPEAITEPRPGLLYVDLRQMRDADFEKAIPRLAAAKGIVFDLRGWSEVSMLLVSHLTTKTLDALTWEVPVYQLPYRQDPRFLRTVNRVGPLAPKIKAKVAFLADARTFQNSERLLETIAWYRFGEIVGAPTAGNVGNPNWSDLPGGWTFTWTGRRALRRDGSLLNGVGIEPTISVERTLAGALAGKDEVIERGLALVSK